MEDLPHILVVDDDGRLRDLLSKFLAEHGFMVVAAADAAEARHRLASLDFDLIILDLMMPGESGLSFARDLRKRSAMPILMLTAMAEPEDRIGGLESGADDYLTKPFEPRELLLRINNILKRVPRKPVADQIRLGNVVFDLIRDEVTCDGTPIRLTDVESALLRVLAERPGEIFTRDDLIRRTGATGGGRAVDVQVARLRRKIEPDQKIPRYLQTVRGQGYMLKPD